MNFGLGFFITFLGISKVNKQLNLAGEWCSAMMAKQQTVRYKIPFDSPSLIIQILRATGKTYANELAVFSDPIFHSHVRLDIISSRGWAV